MLINDKVYRVGIYTRLSKEDGNVDESNSIETQKLYLTDFVKKKGWQIVKVYSDDGFSGTNFNRPDFQRMLKDIENKEIDCVITKDLSRLGRSYLDCGFYLEVYFPENQIRYIAVNDGVDTLNNTTMDITPFKNILNEMYAKDTSVKIKSARKTRFQNGEFITTYPPYGYKKDPNMKNHLIVDENARATIRLIFDLALQGLGVRRIRLYLIEHKVLKPAAYLVRNGAKGLDRLIEKGEYNWVDNSVRSILRSPIYAGNIVTHKRVQISLKSKRRLSRKPEEWEIVYNTHEGIVTQEEFDIVQKMMNSRRAPESTDNFDNIFNGIIKCADCGYAMTKRKPHRKKRSEAIDNVVYTCNNYRNFGSAVCSEHAIEARTLVEIVLKDINYYADIALKDENIVNKLKKQLSTMTEKESSKYKNEHKKLNKRLSELDKLFSNLYEDKVLNHITEYNYLKMSQKYQDEQNEIMEKSKIIENKISEEEKSLQGAEDFVSLIKKYKGIEQLDRKILNTLIERIEVSEKYFDEDGKKTQKVKIFYKYIGTLKEIDYYVQKKLKVQEEPKVCEVCGEKFQPTSNIQKYCKDCRKEMNKKRGAEAKRKWREEQKLLKQSA